MGRTERAFDLMSDEQLWKLLLDRIYQLEEPNMAGRMPPKRTRPAYDARRAATELQRRGTQLSLWRSSR